tara:strand:+ start:190 stop:1629 length:1440 start_codon:yes stop_codon:yes gene_type:complete
MLTDIIKSLNKEEKRFFKIFSKRTLDNKERKDLILFDEISKNGELINEKELFKKLNLDKKNNFYQLKNRLYKEINKSMLVQHFEKEKDLFTLSNVLLSRIHKRKGNLDIAYKYLKKAERKAKVNEAFEVISLIYNEILKLAYDLVTINVEEYIKKQRINKQKLDWSQEIDLVLAVVMQKIKTAQNFNSDSDIFILLDETVKKFSKNKLIAKSPKFRIKVYQAISRVLLQKSNFLELEKYLLKTFHEFNKDDVFNKNNHEQRLMMITYITNCLYKNGKNNESLKYSNTLLKAMNDYDKMLYNKYLFFYYNSLVINYSSLNKEKALLILKEAKGNDIIKGLPTFSVFIYLNTALIYFDQKKYKLARKNISRLILQKDFIELDKSFQMKIHISELIIIYSSNEFDRLEEKIKHIKLKFKKILSSEIRENIVLEIINDLIFCSNIYVDKKLNMKINRLVEIISDNEAKNQDIISYNEWLKNLK